MPHPRGGERLPQDLRALRDRGVDIVVSLLTGDEVLELELHGEPESCAAAGITFRSLPIPDRGVPPDSAPAHELIHWIVAALAEGKGVAIHCWGGIGRSGLVATAILTVLGSSSEAARATVSAARGHPAPETEAQRSWIESFACSCPAQSPI
ncbi:MAG: phosphatase domain-containing putative toxin [Dehalococcoidia bacterium]